MGVTHEHWLSGFDVARCHLLLYAPLLLWLQRGLLASDNKAFGDAAAVVSAGLSSGALREG